MNFRVCEYCGAHLELKEDPMSIELSELYERFGRQTRLISLKQAAEYCRRDPRTLLADKTFPIKARGKQYDVSVVRLARWLTT